MFFSLADYQNHSHFASLRALISSPGSVICFFELINACATICQSKCHLAVDLHPAIAAALLKLKSIILCECRLSTTTTGTGTGTFFNSLTVME